MALLGRLSHLPPWSHSGFQGPGAQPQGAVGSSSCKCEVELSLRTSDLSRKKQALNKRQESGDFQAEGTGLLKVPDVMGFVMSHGAQGTSWLPGPRALPLVPGNPGDTVTPCVPAAGSQAGMMSRPASQRRGWRGGALQCLVGIMLSLLPQTPRTWSWCCPQAPSHDPKRTPGSPEPQLHPGHLPQGRNLLHDILAPNSACLPLRMGSSIPPRKSVASDSK